jgi:2-oxoglutarate dehydrogenase E2 component (dihydrolipoamide succinyltransferase)
MAIEIKVPPLGESLVDAVVGQWLKSEGEDVARGDTILELETDKVNLDVTAEDDGVLGTIQKQEGDTVTVGEVLGMIEAGSGNGTSESAAVDESETEDDADETSAEAPPQKESPEQSSEAESEAEQAKEAPKPSSDDASEAAEDHAGRAAPAVRRMAEEHDIDIAKVEGSGPGGRITRDDLLTFAASQRGANGTEASSRPQQQSPQTAAQQPKATDEREDEERIKVSRRRQTIAKRLVEAQQTAAMLTTFNEIDMSAVMELRSRRKEAFKEAHGVNLGFMSFFTKAAIGALKAFPEVNSELQGEELLLKKHYDIGVAVGVEEGLVVPVIRDADRKGFAEIESSIVELAGKARDNKLAIAELQGGTFTITNGGVFGSLLSTPILNTPQVGILGMHTIQQRPVAVDGEVVIRPMMYVALSYDHRIVDGQQAVQFLVKIKQLIEDPETLLLEG